MVKIFKYLFTALEEEPGVLSIMRVGFFALILTSCASVIYLVIRGGAIATEVTLILGVLSGGLGGKVWQKKYEQENINTEEL